MDNQRQLQSQTDISGCCIAPQPPDVSGFETPDVIPAPPSEPAEPAPKVDIDVQIKTLQDLIDLADKYELGPQYNINIDVLKKIAPELREIRDMIGMKDLKTAVVDQIIYFMQDLHSSPLDAVHDYKHVILTGPPGTGKTEVAKILGRMFVKMGVLGPIGGNQRFRKATRTDLVAGYLGQTAIKTMEVVKSCLGGVLFIDEAYSLTVSTDSKPDSYAKECLDTLCEALSDHRNDLMVIIAGYEEEIGELLKSNRGLESRFIWRYNIAKYTADEMCQILLKKVEEQGWTVAPDAVRPRWFENREFRHFGRDIEKLWTFIKIRHSRRVYGGVAAAKRQITEEDLDAGYELFLENQGKREKQNLSLSLSMLYV
jgi:SpoVK/Ycf46/Vps4 family AAA+-type ATPase